MAAIMGSRTWWLGLAWWLSGCAPPVPVGEAASEVGSDPASSGTGSSSTTSTTATTSSSTGEASESTDSGVATTSIVASSSDSEGEGSSLSSDGPPTPVGCYDPLSYPWAGALCGAAENPCSTLVDEHVDPDAYRQWLPGVGFDEDCTPWVAFNVSEGSQYGHLARRIGADDWDDVVLPDAVSLAGVVADVDLHGVRVVTAGNWITGQRFYDGTLAELDAVPGEWFSYATAIGSLGHGVLHVGLFGEGGYAGYARYDGASWALTELGDILHPNDNVGSVLAVSPDDEAHMVYFADAGDDVALTYMVAPDGVPEVVGYVGFPSLPYAYRVPSIAIADTTVHVLFARRLANGLHDLVHGRRVGAGAWELAQIVAEDDTDASICGPAQPGASCEFDYVRYRPLGVIASHGGDVRVLYAEDHHIGTAQAWCDMICSWDTDVDTSEYHGMIASPHDDGYDHAPWIERNIRALDAEVDGVGHIHIAADVYTGNDSAIDYVQLGAAP